MVTSNGGNGSTGLELLTVAAVAGLIGTSDMHVYRAIAAGEIQAVDIANPGSKRAKLRVRADELDAYLKSRVVAARSAAS